MILTKNESEVPDSSTSVSSLLELSEFFDFDDKSVDLELFLPCQSSAIGSRIHGNIKTVNKSKINFFYHFKLSFEVTSVPFLKTFDTFTSQDWTLTEVKNNLVGCLGKMAGVRGKHLAHSNRVTLIERFCEISVRRYVTGVVQCYCAHACDDSISWLLL